MKLSRYQIPDAYTLEELRREYQNSDAKGRIRLMEKLCEKNSRPPFEIALLAVEDQYVEVRQWVARNYKHLDYPKMLNNQADQNLVNRLKNDPDPFVRACLQENPNISDILGPWSWGDLSHLERLAFVRNPYGSTELIERIFDPEDKELGINLEERKELVWAFLTNSEFLTRIDEEARTVPLFYSDAPERAQKFLATLWELASRWPKESGIPNRVYQSVPVDTETIAETYRTCDEPRLRQVILADSILSSRHGQDEIYELGIKDPDGFCRYLAYSKIDYLEPEDLEAVLEHKDIEAIRGLAGNRSLYKNFDKYEDAIAFLKRLENSLEKSEIEYAHEARQRIEETREEMKKQPPKDSEKLFGPEGREGSFLEDKIDFIGKAVLEVTETVRAVEGEQTNQRVLLLVMIGLLVGLLIWRVVSGY